MFILKLAGKILLLPVWLILFVIGLAVKMTVQTYAVVRGILGFLFTLLIIATAYCYHDWVQVAFRPCNRYRRFFPYSLQNISDSRSAALKLRSLQITRTKLLRQKRLH